MSATSEAQDRAPGLGPVITLTTHEKSVFSGTAAPCWHRRESAADSSMCRASRWRVRQLVLASDAREQSKRQIAMVYLAS